MSKKHLVNLIEKMAQDILNDKNIFGPTAGGGAGSKPAYQSSNSGTTPIKSSSHIKQMQQALINLANAATSKIEIKDPTEAAKTSAFNNFLDKNIGEVNLSAMGNLGTPQSPSTPDGNWGAKTQMALKTARAFVVSLLKIVADNHLQDKADAYLPKGLDGFQVNDNVADVSEKDKEEWAPLYTTHIEAIHKLYDQLRNIASVGAGAANLNKPLLEKAQLDSLNNTFKVFNIAVPGIQNSVPITIENLMTPAAFEKWKQDNKVELSTAQVVKQIRDKAATQSGGHHL